MKDETFEKASNLRREMQALEFRIEHVELQHIADFDNPLIKELAMQELQDKLRPVKIEYDEL